ncbi:MAG: hypothetical protein JSW46_14605 [Gemmatimonadota bacterium]|nr:MAG: hypothetical protein JSW46_14605 [Gemmatimonadota bacterium]
MDLTHELTVFVPTVGYPTLAECLDHLRAQDCTFKMQLIERVAPLSAAFQRMLDDCSTPYFAQVDEDMLLYPHAIRTLYERISQSDARVAQYVCALYDVHLDRVIYGLKIYRHEIVRRYPYRDTEGCEWDQVRRFRADGFLDIRVPLQGATRDSESTLGLHGTRWTPQAAYIRFATLERKRRKGNKTHAWVREAALRLCDRFLDDMSEVDFYALMGVLAGSLSNNSTTGREKDYRRYDETPGLRHLDRFVQEVRTGWSEGDPLADKDGAVDVLPPSP